MLLRIDTSASPDLVPEGQAHGKHSHDHPHFHFFTAPGSKNINGRSFMRHVASAAVKSEAGAVTLFIKGEWAHAIHIRCVDQ
jgi:hypothetical protein